MFENNNKKARILIADDEPPIRELLAALLSDHYDCVEVGSAEEALARLGAEQFDLVLTDILMGGISGLEMLPQALERAPDTVVIMISGEGTIESAITAMRAGAFDYITKPFTFPHVEVVVRRALEHHALRVAKRLYENHLEALVDARTVELRRANIELQRQISERQRAEEKAIHMEFYDALTGLPNQTLFKDRLAHELSGARSSRWQVSTLLLSLDRFQKITETLGYALGDQLLQAVAGRLTGCVSKHDTVAYFGGEEFALLLKQVTGAEDAAKIAGRIRQTLKPAFNIDGHELFVTTSIGISIYPEDGEDGQTMLKNSSAALFRTRQGGGDDYQFYTADMNERALKRLRLENDLRRALEQKEFIVHYQPKIETLGKRIVGMEALVRWQHPELGLVSPAEFIPLAEETGLIAPLGEWVLYTACAQNKAWQDAGLERLRVSVNLSLRQFRQVDLVEMIERTLSETGLAPECLELELTESSMMKDAAHAVETLNRLRALGIRISIDDFGSGYSSLSYLKHLPIDVLKIDQTFVRDMNTDPNDAAIVMAIITLAHSLNLQAIAEGVETEEQFNLLRLLRCDEVQGYLFSKPVTAEVFETLLRESQSSARGTSALEYA
ncbi:MAG: putative bifunctional diguanylate cyclase/phosphodiesterase [Pyrinomonadaceae bacterium]